jgi:nucleotide-binding universal stress UspA family protein
MKIAHSTAPVVAEPASRLGRILAPTDFSPLSKAAVDATMALVMANHGASVTLLHVVEPSVEISGKSRSPHPHASFSSRIEQANQSMKEWRAGYSDNLGEALETRVVTGAAAQTICDMAREEGFDLIVLSSHGHMGLDSTAIGSVAEQVVQVAPCPVLVAKAFTQRDGVPVLRKLAFKFAHILVGYDHRAGSRHALDMACTLSERDGSQITLVHSLEPAPVGLACAVDSQKQVRRIREAMDRLAMLRERKLPDSHDWDLRVEMGAPWDVIVKSATESSCDLIIVGPHEHTRWGHCYVGSTAQRVVREAPCSVLVVK